IVAEGAGIAVASRSRGRGANHGVAGRAQFRRRGVITLRGRLAVRDDLNTVIVWVQRRTNGEGLSKRGRAQKQKSSGSQSSAETSDLHNSSFAAHTASWD